MARHVRILDAEQELPSLVPGEEPVEHGCPCAAYVKVPRGAGRESYANITH